MTGLLWAVLGTFSGLGMAAIGDMVSEEVRDRLDHLPHAILRLAAKRLDPALRAPLYEELWLPDLAYHLKGDEARPVTRLYHGICFAVGMLASARRSSRSLNGARPQDSVPPLPDTHDAVAAVIDAAKAVVAHFRLPAHPGLDTAIVGNRLFVAGELDIATESPFRDAIRALGEVSATTLVLDLTDVSFMDGVGIKAIASFAAELTPPRRLMVKCRHRPAQYLTMFTTKRVHAAMEVSITQDRPAGRPWFAGLSGDMKAELFEVDEYQDGSRP